MSAEPGGAPPVLVRVTDTAVARVAAHRALAVPGVVALQADPGPAGPVAAVGSRAQRPPPAGASATVAGGSAVVALTIVTRLGHRCREVAQAVQREVAAEVSAYTGLAVTVSVTIADVLLD